jgi:hypothetical protein
MYGAPWLPDALRDEIMILAFVADDGMQLEVMAMSTRPEATFLYGRKSMMD